MNALWQAAHAEGWSHSLKQLHERRVAISVLAIAADWTAIAASTYAALHWGPWAVALALVVIGNRQRAPMVLLHDAAHRRLAASPLLNDGLARLLLAWPMFTSLTHYRRLHEAHNRHLGDPLRDSDYLDPQRFAGLGWQRMLLTQVLGRGNLMTALVGQWAAVRPRARAAMAAWWVLALVLAWQALGGQQAALIAALWMSARVLVYHPIISFVIISDHVGLPPASTLTSTRNHPRGPWSWLLHPHGNGMHLTHHLVPGVPHHALNAAHTLLGNWLQYAQAEHCDGYFQGRRSVVASWRRNTVNDAHPSPMEVR